MRTSSKQTTGWRSAEWRGKYREGKCQTAVTQVLLNDRHSCTAAAIRRGKTCRLQASNEKQAQKRRPEVRTDGKRTNGRMDGVRTDRRTNERIVGWTKGT